MIEVPTHRARPRRPLAGAAVALSLLVIAPMASAWEFTPGLPCLLIHAEDGVSVELTYDPRGPRYSITVMHPDGWSDAPSFAMRFEGPMPIAIGTDRHELDPAGRSVSVMDNGFGNVLNGLQFNAMATATLGTQSVTVSLDGAAAPVAAFRACEVEAGV